MLLHRSFKTDTIIEKGKSLVILSFPQKRKFVSLRFSKQTVYLSTLRSVQQKCAWTGFPSDRSYLTGQPIFTWRARRKEKFFIDVQKESGQTCFTERTERMDKVFLWKGRDILDVRVWRNNVNRKRKKCVTGGQKISDGRFLLNEHEHWSSMTTQTRRHVAASLQDYTSWSYNKKGQCCLPLLPTS